jgi:hypothetical protein
MPGEALTAPARFSSPAHAHASPPVTGGAPNTTGTANAPQTATLPDDEKYILQNHGEDALRYYQKNKGMSAQVKRDLAEAHRIYKSTGKIPQTKTSFSGIEVKEGRLMERSERYDAMLKKQGKTHAEMGDVLGDYRDADYLSKDEFKEEFDSRRKAERQACKDDNIRPGTIHKCQEKVNEKYGGSGYKEWRQNEARKTYQQIQKTGQKINAVKNSGPGGLAGRVIGRAIGGEKGEEIGGMIGGGFDLGIRGRIARGGGQNTSGTGGTPPRRDNGAEIRNKPPTSAPAPPTAPPPPSSPPKGQTTGQTGQPKPPAAPSTPPKDPGTIDSRSSRAPQPADASKSSRGPKSHDTADASRPPDKPVGGAKPPVNRFGGVPPQRPNAEVTIQTAKGPKVMTHAEYNRRWNEASKWVSKEMHAAQAEARQKGKPLNPTELGRLEKELDGRAQVAWDLKQSWRINGADPDFWIGKKTTAW